MFLDAQSNGVSTPEDINNYTLKLNFRTKKIYILPKVYCWGQIKLINLIIYTNKINFKVSKRLTVNVLIVFRGTFSLSFIRGGYT